jgi:hypothetical protein
MDDLKYYIADIDGYLISCPKCGKELKELTFFNLAIEIYSEKNKLMEIIQCEPKGCDYEGGLLDWVGFIRNF